MQTSQMCTFKCNAVLGNRAHAPYLAVARCGVRGPVPHRQEVLPVVEGPVACRQTRSHMLSLGEPRAQPGDRRLSNCSELNSTPNTRLGLLMPARCCTAHGAAQLVARARAHRSMLRCAVSSIRTSTKPVATSAQAVISRALACAPMAALHGHTAAAMVHAAGEPSCPAQDSGVRRLWLPGSHPGRGTFRQPKAGQSNGLWVH